MDELLWLLFATATVSAATATASLATWCLVGPRKLRKVAEPASLHDSGDCDSELSATLPTTTTLGADSKFYLSSAGKTLHLYPTCPGRNARRLFVFASIVLTA